MINNIVPKFSITQNQTNLQVYHANIGEGLNKHEHLYSHLIFCHAGKLIIRKEGRSAEMTANSQPINLVANEWHEIETLEDGTIFVDVFDSTLDGYSSQNTLTHPNYLGGIQPIAGGLSQKDQLEMYLGSMIQKILAETIDSTV